MSKPSDEHEVTEEDLLQQLQRMPLWMRVVLKYLVVPLLKTGCFIEGFFCTRWEIIPLADLPDAKERWGCTGVAPDQVRAMVKKRDPFLCPECKMEVQTERQDVEELFPDVWEMRKYGRCEECAADREHVSRLHHGFLLFREDDQWMAVVPLVPFLRRCWLRLWG